MLGLIYAFRAFAHQRELAQTNAALALRNERLFLQAVKSQVTALDVKDNYTARHSAAVARWATDIAEAMDLSKQRSEHHPPRQSGARRGQDRSARRSAQLPGAGLEGDAWRLIETHCQNGHKILKTIDQFDELAEVILYHHEKYDGSGYPTGLAGEDIPLISRIICVADSYSAMVSDRPYRKALAGEGGQERAAQARRRAVRPGGGGRRSSPCSPSTTAATRTASRSTSTSSSPATASCASCRLSRSRPRPPRGVPAAAPSAICVG